MEPVPDWEDGLWIVLKTALGSFMNHSKQLFNMQISGQEEPRRISRYRTRRSAF